MKLSKDYEKGVAEFDFGTIGKFEASLDEISDQSIKDKLALYGLTVKVTRAAAGKGGDTQEAYDACLRVWENLKKGIWGTKPQGMKDILKQQLLNEIKATEPELREPLIRAMAQSGMLARVGLTVEEAMQAAAE